MRLAVNAVSAKVGGAVTYLQNILPELKKQLAKDTDSCLMVWRSSSLDGEHPWPDNIEYRQASMAGGAVTEHANPFQRVWFDQIELPKQLEADAVDVLFSSANFGLLRRACRQVLLVRNTVPFETTYLERMPFKVKAKCLLQRWLILRSIASSSAVVFPSEAMLNLAASFTNGRKANWQVAYYGARHDLFYPLQEEGEVPAIKVRLLHVSLYCDQKNMGTLLRAVKILSQTDPQRYYLKMTAGLEQGDTVKTAATPSFHNDQELFYQLRDAGIAEDVKRQKYAALPSLYRSSDIFVFPSYTESFGHPLVEAMACGLPIVASDIPVNREICGDAAVYFSTFDEEDCAYAIRRVANDMELRRKLRATSLTRAKFFTWERHVAQLINAFRLN